MPSDWICPRSAADWMVRTALATFVDVTPSSMTSGMWTTFSPATYEKQINELRFHSSLVNRLVEAMPSVFLKAAKAGLGQLV